MTTTGQIIRWSTPEAVVGVAAVAAVASYEHAYALVRAHGETGWIGRLVPLTVDGLIYASLMVVLDSARRQVPVPALARWLLGLGIAATLAANVARGLGHGPVGAAVATCSTPMTPPCSPERRATNPCGKDYLCAGWHVHSRFLARLHPGPHPLLAKLSAGRGQEQARQEAAAGLARVSGEPLCVG